MVCSLPEAVMMLVEEKNKAFTVTCASSLAYCKNKALLISVTSRFFPSWTVTVLFDFDGVRYYLLEKQCWIKAIDLAFTK